MARILVVDDDPDILKLADQVLSSAGHVVFAAEDAIRAIEFLENIDFDLLISDANMPHYSGFELIKTLRGNAKYKDLNIAMLTGRRERRDVERAVQMGVNDYIVKPLDPLLLIQKIGALFEKNPARRHPEYKLNAAQSAGTLHRHVQIESISELGLRIITDVPLVAGNLIDLNAEIFTMMEMTVPPLKVVQVERDPVSGVQRANVIFLGAREETLQKIRRWIYTHGSSQRVA